MNLRALHHRNLLLTEIGFRGGEEMHMLRQIQEVYSELGQIQNSLRAFDLGQHVPKPLADRLTSLRRILLEVSTSELNGEMKP